MEATRLIEHVMGLMTFVTPVGVGRSWVQILSERAGVTVGGAYALCCRSQRHQPITEGCELTYVEEKPDRSALLGRESLQEKEVCIKKNNTGFLQHRKSERQSCSLAANIPWLDL